MSKNRFFLLASSTFLTITLAFGASVAGAADKSAGNAAAAFDKLKLRQVDLDVPNPMP